MLYLIMWLLWGIFKCTGDIEIYMLLKRCEYIMNDEVEDERVWRQSL
ncbi:hypothetical protein [Calorimonas adulescens]|nr:hypothetical protein [Calorimonas adulescens]